MKYIILDDRKRATHKFLNGEGAKSWDEVKDFDNVGLIVPKPFIVLDFDTASDADIILAIIKGMGLKCRVMKTTRGIHVWFKSEEPWKCFKKTRLAAGIYSDCKSHSKNAYVKIKDGGIMREWILDTPAEEIQEVPRWLFPVTAPSGKFEFKGMGDGDGRNQELYNYIIYLQSKGFSRDEIRETVHVVNDYVFADQLSEYEIDTICRDEAFMPDEEIKQQRQQVKGFKHDEFGDDLIDTFHIVTVNNQMYIYEDGYYQQDEKIIERRMLDLFSGIKQAQRAEVLSYIRIKTHMPSGELKVNPYVINLKNTRLDVRTGERQPFGFENVEFDRIPVKYDPAAECEALDQMLQKVFCDDTEVLNLFEEMIGACLIKHNRYQKAFMLYGSGSNGKSTVLDIIKKFLGSANYSSIPLEQVTARFNTAELENKLANIGDDIDNVVIRDTGTLKKLFSGNSIQVERKGERPFTIEPYATHIYSANIIPRSFDKSDGFYRRWIFIPFNARFSAEDPDYDPMIEDKVTTDEAMSHLLNIGLRGAQRLLKNGRFTEPESVKKALEQYKTENSTVLSWIDDVGIDERVALATSRKKLYSDFADWCKQSGVKADHVTGKKAFFKEVIAKFGFEDVGQQKSDGQWYFRIKI